ncbi:AMP-binding enzyme [Dactylonectria macrodidyma]|uniref:AMP-binding enzyme n=1 Tax=Dactylonectria macrodidyma TaxID=307937 RepID=A0A9P9IGW0_9HYPO|nr:AMP-binding enzyme [Dactylonectria macrodidyma]
MFFAPSWISESALGKYLDCCFAFYTPDSITIEEFINSDEYGRLPRADSRNAYTCGLTGQSLSAEDVHDRTSPLASALAQKLGLKPNKGVPLDKVIAIHSVNTIDYMLLVHAIHRLSGVATPASAACTVPDLQHQLQITKPKAIFTCAPLLEVAEKAAERCGIEKARIFILSIPGFDNPAGYETIDQLMGRGQSTWQPAFISMSSGTSGLPKACIITHYNIMSNIRATAIFEKTTRSVLKFQTQVTLGLLPLSHIFGLVTIAYCAAYQGDELVVLNKFDIKVLLSAIQRFKIERLFAVPPIVIQLLRHHELAKAHDLSSVRNLHTGAAPLGPETVQQVLKHWPHWHIGQGYGMTETATLISTTSEHDILVGSSGSLIPGIRAKLVSFDGKEINEYGTPGELLIQSPSVISGYLDNKQANEETFFTDKDGRWIRTGDEVLIRKSAAGHEHLFIVDRIKELIKTKGYQVAPAELESYMLSHQLVDDCAVIAIPDESAGEVPKAFVVLSTAAKTQDRTQLANEICQFVEQGMAPYKKLKGGVEFVDTIPKSPSGKILRRLLKEKEKRGRTARGSRL